MRFREGVFVAVERLVIVDFIAIPPQINACSKVPDAFKPGEPGTCQWDETHPVKKLLYNIRAWLIFNLAHTPNHCLIVR